ncbi:Hypothetical protein NTJ_16058 [Nesidiocoris tenuis]|uniref:Uncharacterized protein n=1 Tax=Nesidiocoris tenuis TaxID=355587 RepID=A0ABN7BFU2_9HEMI|nr:Hypothetical protein NTJ_16058 [Nesidiocoris tenuis]
MDDYHGRTELGVGEHEHMKKRLDAERHREYQEHIARKYGEPMPVWEPEAEVETAADQSAEVKYDGDEADAEHVNEAEEAAQEEAEGAHADPEYTETSQPDSLDGDAALTHGQMTKHEQVCAEAKENASNQDEESLSGVFGGESNWWKGTEERRRQRQQNYADDLREQIAEQKLAKEVKKAKDDDDDRQRDVEHARHGSFECGYYSNQTHNS